MVNGAHPLVDVVDKLRAIRARSGLSQVDLEELAGLPAGRVGHWEAGISHPSLSSLIIWADALGCKLILGGTPVPDRGSTPIERQVLMFMTQRRISICPTT